MCGLALTLLLAACDPDKGPAPDTGTTPVDSRTDSAEDSAAPTDSHSAEDTDDEGWGGTVGAPDADGDGYTDGRDCDDADPAVHPGATEICDDLDNDCDDEINEGLYVDLDGDGYGTDPVGATCVPGTNVTRLTGDCDDTNAEVRPRLSELCDNIDNDCDGLIDERLVVDADGDGDGSATATGCVPGEPASTTHTDCDDADPAVNREAVERCDGLDNDCNLDIDDLAAFVDLDGDGFGGAVRGASCAATTAYVETGGDCDDDDATAWPGAEEVCDGVDNDCDGEGDEELAWIDVDLDGYGESERSGDCDPTATYVREGGDCDDADPTIFPGQCDGCNDVDDDCDGEVDNGASETTSQFYPDEDGDGYGDADSRSDWAWDCEILSWYATNNDDCDDTRAGVHPDMAEVCQDGVDNDCDGLLDCEDDDCAESDCAEVDCADGVDGDRDGSTDCQDDDCWGTDCGVVVSRVTGGSFSAKVQKLVNRDSSERMTSTVVAASGSVTGQVRAYSGAGALVASCDWQISRARMLETSTQSRESGWGFAMVATGSPAPPPGTADCSEPWNEDDTSSWGGGSGDWYVETAHMHDAGLARDSVTVETGCGVAGDDFLPRELLWDDGVGWRTADGALWYGGAWRTTATTTSSPGSDTVVRGRAIEVELSSQASFRGPMDP